MSFSEAHSKEPLFELALEARAYAHCEYSGHKVGAAILLTNGKKYVGCNIENASYGATVCAERVAIWKAFSENLARAAKISEIAVATDQANPWPPCGECLQVIAEFASPDTKIILTNLDGPQKTFRFSELFPKAFYPNFLEK